MSAQSSTPIDVEDLNVKYIQFACKVRAKNVRTLINLIRSLNFTNNTEMQFSESGMKYIAEESQFFQGVCYIKEPFFEEYRYKTSVELLNFSVDLTKFTEFLSAFIDNNLCQLKIVYYGDTRPMAFIVKQIDSFHGKLEPKHRDDDNETSTFVGIPGDMEDSVGKVTTEYIITTKNTINPIDFNQVKDKPISKIVLEASGFLECLQDFDSKYMSDIQLLVKKNKLHLRSVGVQNCETTVKIKYSLRFIQRKEIVKCSKFIYKFQCFKSMIKGCQMATMLSIETFPYGLLRLQMMVKSEEQENLIFIEYNITANTEEDSDDDNNEDDSDGDNANAA